MTRCDHTTSPSGEKLIANRPNISGQAFNASEFHRISETTALVRLLLELLEEARSAMKCASRGRPDMTKRVRIVAGLAVFATRAPECEHCRRPRRSSRFSRRRHAVASIGNSRTLACGKPTTVTRPAEAPARVAAVCEE
jgi:hypothetical protein